MMRVLKVFVLAAFALALLVAGLVWVTAPSASSGRLLLRANTNFTKDRFSAYVGPWGGQLVAATRAWSRFADGITIDLKRFPADTKIKWRWPPISPSFGPGVWGYDFVGYDNYAGAYPEKLVAPTRVRDLQTLRQSFRWSLSNGLGDANVLTEFFLHDDPTDFEKHSIEVGWFLHAPQSTIFFYKTGRLVGTYVDPTGRHWTVRIVDKFCMFAPSVPGDVSSGAIDMLDALRWLKGKGLITGNEWFVGMGIGAEPVTGMGEMTLHEWKVARK